MTYTNNEGLEIAANVYTPANFDPAKTYPAITVAHPNGGVKEQVAGLYAQRLAEQGYITVAADAAYQGASTGEPCQTDKPAHRINDVHATVDFLESYPGVDTDRIGALGICGGGGYTFAAAQSDKRLKAVATVSLFNTILDAFDHALAPPPEPDDLDPRLYGVIDGTLVPCYSWADRPELYNEKHKTTGRNLQVITDQSGNIMFISTLCVGSTHDLTALRESGVLDVLDPEHLRS